MSSRSRLLLAAALLAGPALAAEPAPTAPVERLKKDLFFLAGEECNGRGVGTPGIDKAADHIAGQFKAAGLKPGNGDSFFQPFSIAGSPKLGTPTKLAVTGPNGQKLDLTYARQFAPLGESASAAAAGPLVFAGYGISVKTDKLDYDDYAGLDVKGKVVIVLRKAPRAGQKDNPFEAGDEPLTSRVSKVKTATDKGAAAVVFVNDKGSKDRDALEEFRRGFGGDGGPGMIPVLMMKRAALELMLSADGKTLGELEEQMDKEMKPRSSELKGWEAATQVTINRTATPCKNVVGILDGSGPLANETIVIGAHYDHLGTSSNGSLAGPAGEGKVHYGADDNASGTTALIELARRFGAIKDRKGRRIVFIAFSGEERGLLGSRHYAENPLVPLADTVFMLNMDMLGRSTEVADKDDADKKKDRLVANGLGSGKGFESLVDDANKKFNFKLFKVQAGTGPSDHDSFYRKKVPVLFFYTGTHRDYHRPTDTPDKINYPVLAKVTDMMEGLAKHFAEVPERPVYQTARGNWSDPTEDTPRRTARSGPRLGIMPGNYEETDAGVLVDDVSPGGAAEKGGVKKGDVIVEIGGKPVKNINQYMEAMAGQKAGQELALVVLRDKKKVTVKVVPQ